MTTTLLLLALLLQDDAARAKALLDETAAKLKAAPALAFEKTFTQISERSPEPYGHNVSQLVVRRPNQMRVDATGKDWDMLTLLDGTHLWQLNRKKNEYGQYPQKGGADSWWLRDDPLNLLFFDLAPAKVLEGARDIRVRSEKEGESTIDVITWKAKLASDGAESGDLTLRLGPDRLPRKYIKQYEWRDTIYTHTTDYAKIDLAPKISDDTFKFTPPQGATVRDPNAERLQRVLATEGGKQAQKILEAVRESLRSVKALRYEVVTEQADSPPVQTAVTLKRPDLMKRTMSTAEADASETTVCDGADEWHMDDGDRTYRKYPLRTGAAQSLGYTDPLASLYFESGAPLLLAEAMNVTVAAADLEGTACDVISWTAGHGYTQKIKLWIGPDRHLRQMTTEWSSQGRSGSQMTKYRSLDPAPTIPDGFFAFKPGADWRDITNDRPGEKHLAAGTPAPDFEALDRGGAAIRLSELRGRPVVLAFGRYGHPSEYERAQELQDDVGPRGVIVLAVATGKKQTGYDPKKHTFRLMRPKDAAIAAAYGADIYGVLYLIDKEGKVAAATFDPNQLKTAVGKLTEAPASAPPGGEKEARETLKRAAESLKKADALAYSATWHLKDSVGFTRFECKLQMRRPNLVRLEGTYRSDYGREDPGVFVLDGKNEWGFYPNEKEKKYTCRPQEPTAASGFYDDPVRLFFFGEPLTRWMDLGADLRQTSDRLNGTPCTVVEWRVRYTSDVRYRLWIDGSSTVRRLERTVGGQLFLAADYGKIELEPKIAEGAFKFDPPADAKPYPWWTDYERKLIAVGAEAPDLEAKDLDGKAVKLSAWRGKPVLFITWSFP